jgi:murein DD-endopeptidase MepM/ murein hydrolase activator NlpD
MPRRQLAVKHPHLSGDDIKEVQRKLGLRGNDVDGDYGPDTAARVEEWKWGFGYPVNRINAVLGLPGLALLFGEAEPPADFRNRAKERKGKRFLSARDGVVRPLNTAVPRFSEFTTPDAEGAPDNHGVKHHAGLDWFAPEGSVVRAPVAGSITEAKPSRGTSGQVFGGTAKIEASDRKLWVFRHVVPSVRVGARVRAGQPVAAVSRWDDGAEHAHIEIWKTRAGGYDFENMLDPLKFFKSG